jgi:hypothetical protein
MSSMGDFLSVLCSQCPKTDPKPYIGLVYFKSGIKQQWLSMPDRKFRRSQDRRKT